MRVRLVVAYDGGGFHGFARNDPHPTVGGFLEDALSRVLREPIAITCAGRTDRGVHARGQVVTFDVAADRVDLERVVRSVNGLGGGRVVVHEVRYPTSAVSIPPPEHAGIADLIRSGRRLGRTDQRPSACRADPWVTSQRVRLT